MQSFVRRMWLVKALLATAMIGSTSTCEAGVIIDISPNAGSSFRVGGVYSQVETISWTQTGTYTGVTISALVGSVDGSSETVNAYLTDAIGPSAGSPIATASVTVPSFATIGGITEATLFSGLTLGPDSYYLTLFNPDTTGRVNIQWALGSSTTFGSGVSGNSEYYSNTNPNNGSPNTTSPWRSVFRTSTLYSDGFTVTGTAGGITPEPSTFALFGAGLLGVGAAARRWRR